MGKRKVADNRAVSVEVAVPVYTISETRDSEGGGVTYVRVKGKIEINSHEVGSLSGYIFSRRGNFLYICSAASSETENCSVSFFTPEGVLKGSMANKVSDSCDKGGLLYIESVEIHKDHQDHDYGLTLVHKTLQFFQGRWTIAFMLPAPNNFRRDNKGTFREGVQAISQYFARSGFKQCNDNDSSPDNRYWYLDASKYTNNNIMTKEESKQLQIAQKVEIPELGFLDQSIVTLVSQWVEDDEMNKFTAFTELHKEAITPEVTQMLNLARSKLVQAHAMFETSMRMILENGGNLNTAKALHVACANQKGGAVEVLIRLGADVNYADENGLTPLHIAAGLMNPSMVQILLNHGANHLLRNKEGMFPAASAHIARQDVQRMVADMGAFPALTRSLNDATQCMQLLC